MPPAADYVERMAIPAPLQDRTATSRVDPRVLGIVSELRRRLEALYGDRLEHVILYGSQARGDADAESDIDVLVVLSGEVDSVQEIDCSGNPIWDLSLEHGLAISRVFVSHDRFRTEVSPLLMNVRREGVEI
jgi:uncharacterized protein